MSENRINIGDKVKVFITDDLSFWGTVDYLPQVTGDSWVLVNDDGEVYYVQTFQFMFKPAPETP